MSRTAIIFGPMLAVFLWQHYFQNWWFPTLYLLISITLGLYRRSRLYVRHWESKKRFFIISQKDEEQKKIGLFQVIITLALSILLLFYDPFQVELPVKYIVVFFIVGFTIYSLIHDHALERGPRFDMKIGRTCICVNQDTYRIKTFYRITSFEVREDLIRLKKDKRVFELNGLSLKEEQVHKIQEQLTRFQREVI